MSLHCVVIFFVEKGTFFYFVDKVTGFRVPHAVIVIIEILRQWRDAFVRVVPRSMVVGTGLPRGRLCCIAA